MTIVRMSAMCGVASVKGTMLIVSCGLDTARANMTGLVSLHMEFKIHKAFSKPCGLDFERGL